MLTGIFQNLTNEGIHEALLLVLMLILEILLNRFGQPPTKLIWNLVIVWLDANTGEPLFKVVDKLTSKMVDQGINMVEVALLATEEFNKTVLPITFSAVPRPEILPGLLVVLREFPFLCMNLLPCPLRLRLLQILATKKYTLTEKNILTGIRGHATHKRVHLNC